MFCNWERGPCGKAEKASESVNATETEVRILIVVGTCAQVYGFERRVAPEDQCRDLSPRRAANHNRGITRQSAAALDSDQRLKRRKTAVLLRRQTTPQRGHTRFVGQEIRTGAHGASTSGAHDQNVASLAQVGEQ